MLYVMCVCGRTVRSCVSVYLQRRGRIMSITLKPVQGHWTLVSCIQTYLINWPVNECRPTYNHQSTFFHLSNILFTSMQKIPGDIFQSAPKISWFWMWRIQTDVSCIFGSAELQCFYKTGILCSRTCIQMLWFHKRNSKAKKKKSFWMPPTTTMEPASYQSFLFSEVTSASFHIQQGVLLPAHVSHSAPHLWAQICGSAVLTKETRSSNTCVLSVI